MKILGIETSCDETGIGIYDSERGLLAHILHSQTKTHAPFGGVVPELASRDHIRKVLPLLEEALAEAGLTKNSLDAIAYTAGPGLVGALLVGAAFARSLAFALQIPAIPVHHMEAHLLAPLLEEKKPDFPFLALLVSGGHTLLVQVNAMGDYKILGESLDDAAGEAFDKVAKLLGLPYPGGPHLAKLAEQGNSKRFHFPRPMVNRPGLDFSFSGLKTYALNTLRKYEDNPQAIPKGFQVAARRARSRAASFLNKYMSSETSAQQSRSLKGEGYKADIACAFQDAVVDTLRIKCKRALEQTGLPSLVVAGGVSANLKLREKLQKLVKSLNQEVHTQRISSCGATHAQSSSGMYNLIHEQRDKRATKPQFESRRVYYPRLEFCTDNGAMIAYAGFRRFLLLDKEEKSRLQNDLAIKVYPRWDIDKI